MLFEKLQVLLLERLYPMMFLLMLDIGSDRRDVRLADAERRVPRLPGEKPRLMFLVHPFRGIRLHDAERIGDGQSRWNLDERVDVVSSAANRECNAS